MHLAVCLLLLGVAMADQGETRRCKEVIWGLVDHDFAKKDFDHSDKLDILDLLKTFHVYDANGDQNITLKEMREGARLLHRGDDSIAILLFHQLDTDGNGAIDYDEYFQLFTLADFNGDEVIEKSEFEDFLEELYQRMYQAADKSPMDCKW